MALTGKGVSTPTPPVLPLTLDVSRAGPRGRWGGGAWSDIDSARTEIGHCHVPGCPDYDAKLVLGGDVKKTTKQLPAGSPADDQDRRPGSST